MEWLIPSSDICSQCLEWWWVLYRSFRSQVRSLTMTNLKCSLIYSRRFERELEALRKELAETSARLIPSTPINHASTFFETDNSSAGSVSPDYLAISLPGTELDSSSFSSSSVPNPKSDSDPAKKKNS